MAAFSQVVPEPDRLLLARSCQRLALGFSSDRSADAMYSLLHTSARSGPRAGVPRRGYSLLLAWRQVHDEIVGHLDGGFERRRIELVHHEKGAYTAGRRYGDIAERPL